MLWLQVLNWPYIRRFLWLCVACDYVWLVLHFVFRVGVIRLFSCTLWLRCDRFQTLTKLMQCKTELQLQSVTFVLRKPAAVSVEIGAPMPPPTGLRWPPCWALKAADNNEKTHSVAAEEGAIAIIIFKLTPFFHAGRPFLSIHSSSQWCGLAPGRDTFSGGDLYNRQQALLSTYHFIIVVKHRQNMPLITWCQSAYVDNIIVAVPPSWRLSHNLVGWRSPSTYPCTWLKCFAIFNL